MSAQDATPDQVTIKVAGKAFAGWKSARITRGIDALVGSFQLGLSQRWKGQPEEWGIGAGDACEVLIGGDVVMSGFIDVFDASIDPDRHAVAVSGMERTVDLTDCSAIHTPGSWKNRKLEQIASDLAAPFGIKVKAVASTGAAFASFALQQGETVFEAIDRMARQRGVLPVTTPTGDVELITPGAAAAGYSLEVGVNFKAVTASNDSSQRFSEYVLKGYSEDNKTRPKATAQDRGVGRHRPLMIVHDDASTPGNLTDRAKYEATTRAGRGQQLAGEVQGWRDAAGALLEPDRRVPVKAGVVGVEGERLLYSVVYILDDRGSRTELRLAPKEAFSLLAVPAPVRKPAKPRKRKKATASGGEP